MEQSDDLSEFAHMWDGSETWELSEYHWDEATVTVVFCGERPTVQELIALRRLHEPFRDLPAARLKAQLCDKSEIELGRFSGMEAREIQERVRQLELPLQLRVESRSFVSYSPIQRTKDGQTRIMLIEDEELCNRVTGRMLERGVPITEGLEID